MLRVKEDEKSFWKMESLIEDGKSCKPNVPFFFFFFFKLPPTFLLESI
jgi:hypothetical protein